ncbi:MAG: hypothetical protein AB7N53_03980 [Candidatus Binatia bacterium]
MTEGVALGVVVAVALALAVAVAVALGEAVALGVGEESAEEVAVGGPTVDAGVAVGAGRESSPSPHAASSARHAAAAVRRMCTMQSSGERWFESRQTVRRPRGGSGRAR